MTKTAREKFSGVASEFIFPQCNSCKNYLRDRNCKAFPFPSTIPEDIFLNKFIHNKKHPEQTNEVLFAMEKA